MRSRYLVIGLCLAGTAAALAAAPKASAPAQFPARVIHLDSAAALEQLRITNPGHYARVERILASADQVCKAGEPKLLALHLDAKDVVCFRSLIFTSYPPQRQLTFRLDDTRYSAMVFLKGPPGAVDRIRTRTE
ncbi:MAG TPA: hypothetical protein VMD49_00325 [Steroidobacteraceae bacterium]|nr:hypothetical protein [Steroidobacteraceae bacterium]